MKVIVLGKMFGEEQRKLLTDVAHEVGAELCFAPDEASIPEEYRDAEVIYGFGVQTAKVSQSLQWLSVPSAGVDYLMKPDSFANKSCILTNSSGAYGVAISEHIIAVSLMLMRGLADVSELSRRGVWGRPKPQRSLKDCRITVLGTGDIGRCFAKRARAFEPMTIIGVNRSGACVDELAGEPLFDRVEKVSTLDALLPETDLLVMSLPDTPETAGIMSRKRIGMLPAGAYIVNVGRGSAIDEEALADFLDARHLGGAALDVFQTEPLPEGSRLWHTKNLLITPHVAGGLTLPYTLNRNVEMFAENLRRYAAGEPLMHVVDRVRGY